jgi:hypothetical protein
MSSKRAIIKTYRAIGLTTGLNPAAVSGDMSDDIVGPTTTIDIADQVCYQVAWTSSDAVGVISVQGSVDGSTFYDLTFSPILTQPNSDNGGYLINLGLIPFTYIRLKYTSTSGSGALTATMSVKGL